MTTKTFSQSKMGRNPFAPKTASASETKPTAATLKTTPLHRSEPKPKSYEQRDYETVDGEGVLLAFLSLPVRSVMFGLKSLLVARYLFAHPKEWRF
jgi:hypothetical protein